MKIESCIALVTGASRGIGFNLSIELARRGATVILVARKSNALDDALAVVKQINSASISIAADVTDRDAVDAMIKEAMARYGRIDILINNAGAGVYGAFLELPPGALERAMNVSFWGTVNCCRAALPGMIERRRGHIVNMGAIDGKFGLAGDTVGAASKAAVIGFSEALAQEVKPLGIKVTIVNPGAVDTESFRHEFADAPPGAKRGVISKEEAATAIIRGIERNKRELFVPGILRSTVLARHLFPAVFGFIASRVMPSPYSTQK